MKVSLVLLVITTIINNYVITLEIQSLQMIVASEDVQVEDLQRMLNKQNSELEEFKKIEELRISSTHDSEVIKYQRDAAVRFSYMIPVTG